ncbi:MAG: hypothetical protein AB7I42_10135 [Bradyrhizobium sp.]|uniref:hypothetical protein n=1 Tax=Bradyrhizobium sp. TaxID=376 RepID=UPI003D0CD645
MLTQKRLSGKNYIDLVEDEHERQSSELPSAAVRAIKNYLLGLIEVVRSARNAPK